MKDNKNKKPLQSLKTSVFSRGLSLAKLTVKAGASAAQHTLSHTFKNEALKEAGWARLLKDQASLLANELGELKGSFMKAGQMLSMYGEYFLPPEANQLLKSLQSDSVALDWKAIEPLLRERLGEKFDELEIDPEALACASMGQVHRARIKLTGEEIVLKVQYPGVDKAIDSDLKALKTLLAATKILPRDFDLGPVFGEVKTMLHQEVDYLLEAKLTQDFHERLKDDPRYIVPRVFPNYSSDKVIALSYEEGARVEEPLVQNLSQNRRNRLAFNYLELYFKEIFDWAVVQTDPHSGNYKIRVQADGQDQLILFDFGATRSYPQSFIGPYRKMISALLNDDTLAFRKAALQIGFIQQEDPESLMKSLQDFCFETIEPFLAPEDPRHEGRVASDGIYDWKNTDLPQRVSQKGLNLIKNFKWRTPPPEIIFLDRKTGGVFIFLSLLKPKIKGRDLLLSYIQSSTHTSE